MLVNIITVALTLAIVAATWLGQVMGSKLKVRTMSALENYRRGAFMAALLLIGACGDALYHNQFFVGMGMLVLSIFLFNSMTGSRSCVPVMADAS